MDTTEKAKLVKLRNEEIPEERFAFMTYLLTGSAAPFLMIVSDSEDNDMYVTLLKKDSAGEQIVKRAKLPFDIYGCIAKCLSAALVQQLKIGRTYSRQYDQYILNIFHEIFYPSPMEQELINRLYTLISTESTFSINIIQDIMKQLVTECKVDFVKYSRSMASNNSSAPLLSFLADIMMQWNAFCQLLSNFAADVPEWKNSENTDMHIMMCGKIKDLVSFIEPSTAGSHYNVFSSNNNEMVYKLTESLMKADPAHRVHLTVIAEDFEKNLLNMYYQSQGSEIYSMQPATVNVYSDKVLKFSKLPVLYAGSVSGQQLPFNSDLIIPVEDGGYLTAPFSSDFSTLVALGKVKIEKMEWEAVDDGMRFTFEYTYNGSKYAPKPREYSSSEITELDDFPKIVIYQVNGSADLYIYSVSDKTDAEVFNGKKIGENIVVGGPVKAVYFKISSDGEYCGQIDYSFVKRRNSND